MPLELPVIFLLPTRLSADELHQLEEQIPSLTYDINEADVVLGKVSQKERALFELRRLQLLTEEVPRSHVPSARTTTHHRTKRRRLSVCSTQRTQDVETSDTGSEAERNVEDDSATQRGGGAVSCETVKVAKLAWLTDSLKQGVVLPLDKYLVYEGRKIPKTPASSPRPARQSPSSTSTTRSKTAEIFARALADAEGGSSQSQRSRYGSPGGSSAAGRRHREHFEHPVKPPPMLKQTTSEHDVDHHLPPIPDYLHTTYSCQRPTMVNPPNEGFIEQLKKIRRTRTLLGDKIGVRAYSSAIATLAAYPHTLSSPREVARLPGCGPKIALLFQEFRDTGQLREVKDAESDPRLSVLSIFYDIWGVAETTAREFYNKGWRDLDDIVEFGWSSLTRVQQIGVKYYDEFQQKIPRWEVEQICCVILEHANRIHPGFQMVIVGGYRRGKQESGDVDVVLSHPDERATLGFAERIVLSLEKARYVTHTLILSTTNSERGQMPVSWKGNQKRAGTGFDTLDKALVVWQDPNWSTAPGDDNDLEDAPAKKTKNPNPHRRVDIIISPWKTAGCAVLGWTSGTTFQRDLRRYCRNERALKFDSSGVRSRIDGSWVDLESGPNGQPAPDMLTAEKRVFAGLGLEYRKPEERCTG
ncbi:hypothetical protein VTK73DRAFT_10238 [Phialemonium thermophilum]|uniref:DNA polymerase n=1 Tax=Phialemonium thermophilum TaxID=223376 RepID=A0ABR3XH52_9PEZI